MATPTPGHIWVDAGEGLIKNVTGWGSRKVGRFVSICHEINPGVDKILEKEK